MSAFMHNKRLQYTVRVGGTNPGLADLMLEQFGGQRGESLRQRCAALQAVTEENPRRKDTAV